MDTLSDAVENGGRLEILRALRVECTRRLVDPNTSAAASASLARRIQDLTDALSEVASEPAAGAAPSPSPAEFVDGLRLIVGVPQAEPGASGAPAGAPGGTGDGAA